MSSLGPRSLIRPMSRQSGPWPSASRPKWMPCQQPRHNRLRSRTPPNASCGCACGSRPAEGNLQVNGRVVTVDALPMIFDHLHRQGVAAGMVQLTNSWKRCVSITRSSRTRSTFIARPLPTHMRSTAGVARSHSWKSNSSTLAYVGLPLRKQCYLAKQPNAERRCLRRGGRHLGRMHSRWAPSSPESHGLRC